MIVEIRSGPMRQRLDEPRQVRKEAAVIAIAVCCGVPGLFYLLIVSECEWIKCILWNFRSPDFNM